MKRLALVFVPIAVVVAGAVTPDSDLGARAVVLLTTQRQDTTVRTAGAAVYPGVSTLREDLSIGKTDGAEQYLIVSLEDAHYGFDGSIFISDQGTAGGRIGNLASIRRYDSTGKYMLSYGRFGQGPGEFRGFNGMHLLRDGRFLQNDANARAVNVFAPNGAHATTLSIPSASPSPGSTSFFVNPNGHMYLLQSTFPSATVPSRRFAIDVNATGQIVDTIDAPVAPELPANSVTGTNTNGTPRRQTVPFSPTFRTAFSPLGYWITARTDRYALDLNMPNGQVISIRRTAPAVPLSAEERAAFRASTEASMRRTQPNWTWNGPDIPRNKPYFMEIMVDLDARIWARVFDTAEKLTPEMDMDDAAINYWEVFEPSGRFIARVRTPIGTLPSYARGDHMLGVAQNADGVQRVVRYKIQWGAEK